MLFYLTINMKKCLHVKMILIHIIAVKSKKRSWQPFPLCSTSLLIFMNIHCNIAAYHLLLISNSMNSVKCELLSFSNSALPTFDLLHGLEVWREQGFTK